MANDEVAFVLGSGNNSMLVIASTAEGRVIRWLQGTKGRHISGLAASPDFKTIYFGADGYVWSIPSADGSPQKIAAGENVSADPNGKDLVITNNVTTSPILNRVEIDGGKLESIHVAKDLELAPVPTGGHSIRQGKMLVTTSPSDSWFYRVAILDLHTGKITPIKISYPGDTLSGNWAADGRVISVGLPLKSRVWRFRAAGK